MPHAGQQFFPNIGPTIPPLPEGIHRKDPFRALGELFRVSPLMNISNGGELGSGGRA